MLTYLKNLLSEPGAAPSPEEEVRLAAASLLLAMMKADHTEEEAEEEAVRQAVGKLLEVEGRRLDELIEAASEELGESVSLHDFTRVLHRQQTKREKRELIRLLWSVAVADGEVDPEEELLVRKVAGLLYVPHEEFIRAKRAALAGHD